MTTSTAGWGGVPDRGLDRVLDLSPPAVRRQTVRRRLLVLLALVVGVGSIVATGVLAPGTTLRPVVELPFWVTLVGLGLMGLAIASMLVGAVTMSRAGSNVIDNHDPLRDLPWPDRVWVRARIAAAAPVAPAQHPITATAADWMARQPGTVPIHVGISLLGLGMLLGSPGIMSFLVGLLLVVEGAVLVGLAQRRARSARRWLSLYALGPQPWGSR